MPTEIICQLHDFVASDLADGEDRCPKCGDMQGLDAQRPPRRR